MNQVTETDLFTLATELEDKRFRLMIDADVNSFEQLLSDEVVYVHSSGFTDDKTSYLKKFREGAFVYHSAEQHLEQVSALGENALMATGSVRMIATVAGTLRNLHTLFLVVWRKESGTWRLLGHQTTSLPQS
ncbi:nuclear transport factor 2 family protein [Pseudomonas gingeri]|uniref:nuclear transport factor 2 family protein n=1 Tax=Pseudomonas gingeri TaxID=117681 RepID=UPI0015A22DE6|nr:nuclear transport factor 2 family protein [Pseudomonas gingeri]NVZ24663.1 nuclear transport factor 2 family protein [Pseudomonas gingeri]